MTTEVEKSKRTPAYTVYTKSDSGKYAYKCQVYQEGNGLVFFIDNKRYVAYLCKPSVQTDERA